MLLLQSIKVIPFINVLVSMFYTFINRDGQTYTYYMVDIFSY